MTVPSKSPGPEQAGDGTVMPMRLKPGQLPLRGTWPSTDVSDEFRRRRRLEGFTRPLLDLLQRVTGMESTYVTEIDLENGEQEILFSRNSGSLDLVEGSRMPWAETLCYGALAGGPRYTTDAPANYPDSAARALGITSYVMCPIVSGEKDVVIGTLCGVSSSARLLDDESRDILELFAEIIGQQIDLEHAAERREARSLATEHRIHERARFLAVAEHKLKSPLTVIRGWADLLRSTAHELTEAQLAEGVETIRRNVLALILLVDELLEEASTEVKVRDLHIRKHDLSGFLESTVAEFSRVSPDHPVVADVPTRLEASFDGGALHQALGHLLENAIKYSPSGGRIVIRAAPTAEGVQIEIVDSGVGVPPGLDIFAPFTRGDESVPGVGLGLHIVQRVLESMGGTIDARRNEHAPGSTLRIQLKAARVSPEDESSH